MPTDFRLEPGNVACQKPMLLLQIQKRVDRAMGRGAAGMALGHHAPAFDNMLLLECQVFPALGIIAPEKIGIAHDRSVGR